MLIATEDEGSGRDYLRRIAAEDEVRRRCTVTFAPYTGSSPQSVVKAAKEADSDMPFDEVWLVFDTEGPQNPQRLNAARAVLETARQLKYRTAVSNPCFEYWLILHFERFTGTLADGSAACTRLRRHIPKYDKGCDCYTPSRNLLDTARRNARELHQERCIQNNGHPCDCHPCTELFKLMLSLFG